MDYQIDEYYMSGADNDIYILNKFEDHYFVVEYSNNHKAYHLDSYTEQELEEYFPLEGRCFNQECTFMDDYEKP